MPRSSAGTSGDSGSATSAVAWCSPTTDRASTSAPRTRPSTPPPAPVVRLAALNSDSVDTGRVGSESVEVYLPLTAGTPPHRVGVLEVYLPYAPIDADVDAGLDTLYRNLAIGLGVLYLVLFVISVSVTRRSAPSGEAERPWPSTTPSPTCPTARLFHRAPGPPSSEAPAHRPTAIAIVDLDRFKEINDTLGPRQRRPAAHRAGPTPPPSTPDPDAVARLGGDEFGVILTDVGDAEEVLQRLRDVIEHEVEVSGLPLVGGVEHRLRPSPPTTASTSTTSSSTPTWPCTWPRRTHAGVVRYDAEQNHYDAANLGAHRRAAPRHRRRRAGPALPAQGRPRRRARRGRRGPGAVAAPDRTACSIPTGSSPWPSRPTSSTGSPTWVMRQALADCAAVQRRTGTWPSRSTCRPAPSASPASPTRSSPCSTTSTSPPEPSDHRDHRDGPAHRSGPGRRRSWPQLDATGRPGQPRRLRHRADLARATCPRCRSTSSRSTGASSSTCWRTRPTPPSSGPSSTSATTSGFQVVGEGVETEDVLAALPPPGATWPRAT